MFLYNIRKGLVCLFLVSLSISLSAQSDKELGGLSYKVKQTNDWVFYSPQNPEIQIIVKNTRNDAAKATLNLQVTTDDFKPVHRFAQSISLSKGDSTEADFSFSVPAPGFYRCTVTQEVDGKMNEIKKFNIGYEPEYIVSLPDNKTDFRKFWDESLAELAKVAPEYKLTLIPDSSTNQRKLYKVSMKSFGGVEISGYYCTPVKKGKYPAIISYMGYGSKPWSPKPNDNPGFVEFVLSVRGQGLQQPTNIYGDWITYGMQSKEDYYYRGAFMDLVRAIDFVASRPEVNTKNIFAEGGSQGGAFTMAACALDHRISAAAPFIPFLSDYPDYFKIVHWPGDAVKAALAKQSSISETQLYDMLSYFDIKNLAGWIKCPIIMASGLQDEVCPPHTNFSGYNRISTEKEYIINPTYGHDVPPSWWNIRMEFFKKHMK